MRDRRCKRDLSDRRRDYGSKRPVSAVAGRKARGALLNNFSRGNNELSRTRPKHMLQDRVRRGNGVGVAVRRSEDTEAPDEWDQGLKREAPHQIANSGERHR